MSSSFIDTNILVYAHDVRAGAKHLRASELLESLWVSESGVLSTQVLQEFYVTITRKLAKRLPRQAAREIIQDYQVWPIYSLSVDDVLSASEIEEKYQLSFWDALIVQAAINSGCNKLYSEDFQDGQKFDSLIVINPFK